MGNSSSPEVASRLRTQKFGNHLERERKAIEKVRSLRDGEHARETNHIKNQEKLAQHAVWHEIGEDLEKNVVEPFKRWSGLNHLQECSQPKAHVESDDDEFAEIEEPKQQEPPPPKGKPVRRTTRDKVHAMLKEVHPGFEQQD